MDNDKAFKFYTVALIGGALCMLSMLVLTGIGVVPAPLVIAEHVGLALLVRTAYKSFDTSRWTVFDLYDDIRESRERHAAPPSDAAGAVG